MRARRVARLPGARAQRVVRSAARQYACRLSLELASRLEALFEMYPDKSRSELMGDLLSLGLAEVERARSSTVTEPTEFHPDTSQPVYLLSGPFAEFHGLTHKHYLAMERALAKEKPEFSTQADDYTLGDAE